MDDFETSQVLFFVPFLVLGLVNLGGEDRDSARTFLDLISELTPALVASDKGCVWLLHQDQHQIDVTVLVEPGTEVQVAQKVL